MQNYKWEVKTGLTTNLENLYERKAINYVERDNILSPQECYNWLNSDSDLKIDIVEINCNSSKSYGADRIGRYFFIEGGADVLVSIIYMRYAQQEVKWGLGNRPEFLLCKDLSIDNDGINYIEIDDEEIGKWCDEKCEEFMNFVKSLTPDRQEKLEAFLNPNIVYNFKYAFPTGKVLCADISKDMSYGEFKKVMIDTFHVRPWHIRRGWTKKNQEEIDSKLLSEMGVLNGTIVVAADAQLDELDRRFHDACHGYMRWRYVGRQWQKIPREERLNHVDALPSIWLALLERFLED